MHAKFLHGQWAIAPPTPLPLTTLGCIQSMPIKGHSRQVRQVPRANVHVHQHSQHDMSPLLHKWDAMATNNVRHAVTNLSVFPLFNMTMGLCQLSKCCSQALCIALCIVEHLRNRGFGTELHMLKCKEQFRWQARATAHNKT